MYILGINAYHGDAAAALIKDGRIVAAVEEERFNRIKHCAGFPTESVKYCLQAAGIGVAAVEHVGISRDPSAHLHKKVLFAATRAAKGMVGSGQRAVGRKQEAGGRKRGGSPTVREGAQPVSSEQWAVGSNSKLETRNSKLAELSENGNGRGVIRQVADRLRNAARIRDLRDELSRALGASPSSLRAQFHNIEHHRAHLASSFFVSPFEHAALLSVDGFGDFVSTMWAIGEGNSIKILGQVEYPHSTGIVYTATTQFLGFPHYGDEGKVMGLAPHGKPRFIEQFRDIIRTEGDGKFSLNLDYFRHHAEGVDMTWDNGSPRIGRIFSDAYARTFGSPRVEGEPLTDRICDIAASLQLRLEEVAFHILNHLHEQTGLTDLGLSGGVAYNSVMNGKILLNTFFRRVFVQPASGDSGTALGVCYQIWNQLLRQPRGEVMEAAYTGPEFSGAEIRAELERRGLQYETCSDRDVTRRAARDIAEGSVVGWFQGRMEFGPRALGNRSIVVDPRRAEMKDVLNTRIKKRESFRPFAPSILEEHVGEYFEQTHPAPTMLMVYQVKPEQRERIPAVTHVDGSGRLQTVSKEVNPRYYQLISDFNELTGVPVVLNTSFNENEPIVCTPRQAIDCFVKTRMDVLYLENYAIRRNAF
ncbi:MAG TPA: carbamoyltransferase C-terminal domain-containing protein [Pyrinomonadaceae bacterium]|nr:carbamoyltransferase C-terminal domain-containing protein [Pyrinomonadaceae bacterium]